MKGLLLVNTGSPASPRPRDVRAFIEAMLSDPLVMTVPNWFRPLLVKGIIGPFRQFGSAKKYDLIWDKELDASPLLHSAQKLAEAIEKQALIPVEVGMVYLQPSISNALDKLFARDSAITELIVLPLFPQYAESSYLTAVNTVKKIYKEKGYTTPMHIVEPYYNDEHYIKAVAETIKPYLANDKKYDKILFNYHSLPLDHVEKGFTQGKGYDYVFQTKETVRLIQHELNLDPADIRVVYSSAFGKNWLEPSLTEQVETMAKSGIKNILVIAPGFAADNLETLFDIGIEARSIFTNHGGEELEYVPSLNYRPVWVKAIQEMIL